MDTRSLDEIRQIIETVLTEYSVYWSSEVQIKIDMFLFLRIRDL
jgi:hypothetical protein